MTNRRSFFKRAAGMALGAIGLDGATLEDTSEGTILHAKVRLRNDSGPGYIPTWDEHEVSRKVPTSIDDPLWKELVKDPDDLHRLAMIAFITNAQMYTRARLRENPGTDPQKYFESYVFGKAMQGRRPRA